METNTPQQDGPETAGAFRPTWKDTALSGLPSLFQREEQRGLSDGSLVLWNIPRVRAQLAEIGLDWEDATLPAARSKPAEATGEPTTVEPARLFALEVRGAAQATFTTEGNVSRINVTTIDDIIRHVQLARVFDDLQEGATYTIRFRAKGDAPRRMRIGVDEGGRNKGEAAIRFFAPIHHELPGFLRKLSD